MLQFLFTGLNVIILFLTAMAQDIAPNVYCNKQNLTWDEARESCMNANGKFIAYKTGLGMDVANLSLKSETDIWTADYAWESTNSKWSEKLCGFWYMDHGKFSLEVMYGDCNKPRLFLCRNSSTKGLDVFIGRKDSINCSATRINSSVLQNLPPGFYWTNSTVNVTTDTRPSFRAPGHRPVLCGAYKKSIGKYFGDCKTKRVSLCSISINAETSNYRNSFDNSCFDNSAATTTTGVMPHVTKSIHPGSVASREDGRSDKQSEKYSNVCVTVGLPVGLGIVVICGIILSSYIIRRYKQRLDKRSPEGEYDVITPNYISSNHIYSTLQRGDNGRFSDARTDETAYNVLTSP